MNMQTVGGGTLLAVKNRMTVLQEIVRSSQESIQNIRNAHHARRESAKSRLMTPTEFSALNPVAPVDADFVAENAEIAAKQAALATAIAQQPVIPFSEPPNQAAYDNAANYRTLNIRPLERRIEELKNLKKIKIDGYARNLVKPGMSLADSEFLQLYPVPTVFATESAAIAAAQTECNALDAFLRSGPYPNAGQYDVALLAFTSVPYP